MVRDAEYGDVLFKQLDDEGVRKLGEAVGGGTERRTLFRNFRDARGEDRAVLERRIALHCGLQTEEERRTAAILDSAKAAMESAEAARLSAKEATDALQETKSYRRATWWLVGLAAASAAIALGSLIARVNSWLLRGDP